MKIKASVIACCLSFNFLSLSMQCQPQLYVTAGNNAQVEMCMTELISEIEKMPSLSKGIVKDICAKYDDLSLEEKQLVFNHLVVFKDSLLTKRREFRDELQTLFPRYDYWISLCDPILKNEDPMEKEIRRTHGYFTSKCIVELGFNVANILTPAISSLWLRYPSFIGNLAVFVFISHFLWPVFNPFGEILLEKATFKKLLQILREDRNLFSRIETLFRSCDIEKEASLNLTIPLLLKLYSSNVAGIEMKAERLLGYRFVKLKDMFSRNKIIVKLKPSHTIDFLFRNTCNPEHEKRSLLSFPYDWFACLFTGVFFVSIYFSLCNICHMRDLGNYQGGLDPFYTQDMRLTVSSKILFDFIAIISIGLKNTMLGKVKKRTTYLESQKIGGALGSIYKDRQVPTMLKLCETLAFGEVPQDEHFFYNGEQKAKLPVFHDMAPDLIANMDIGNHLAHEFQNVNGGEVLVLAEAQDVRVQVEMAPTVLPPVPKNRSSSRSNR